MAQPRSEETFSIMVYCHSPHADLIITVSVKIGYCYAMIAHTGISLQTGGGTIESPDAFQG